MSTFICDIKDVMHLLSHRLFKVSTSNVNHFLQGLRQLRYNNILVLMLKVKLYTNCDTVAVVLLYDLECSFMVKGVQPIICSCHTHDRE